MVRIYTKTGDKGKTSLFGGSRVLKSDLQVEAYGSVDELTSFIGLLAWKIKNKQKRLLLREIQKDLYKIMSHLSGDSQVNLAYLDSQINKFEKHIDKLEEELPKLNKFILPAGGEESVWFHVLRTVCRRAERAVVGFFSNNGTMRSPVSNDTGEQWHSGTILKYLNRLSDLFFMLARKYSKEEFTFGEKEWVS